MPRKFHTRDQAWKQLRVISLLIGMAGVASFALAQLPTATILGVVRDASGAVVPGATLTARNVETGQSRSAVSGGDGSYRFSALPVGSYEVRVSQSGFQAAVRSGLRLRVGQEAVVNFALQVGAVEQTIAVTAEAPLVNTTSGSLGSLVDEQSVSDLPLNGRNYIDLTFLQPGIAESKNMTSGGTFVGQWFSSNGAPLRSNTFMLDGAVMNSLLGAAASSVANNTLGIEGIREWRMVTNTFSAEYGLTMGSQMEIVTKSGTNDFHGTLFEYLRNSALDARNFADYTSPRRLPPFTRNSFGLSVGGPVKQDRVFFFTTYEGLRERRGVSTVANVFPDRCRQEPLPGGCRFDGGTQIAPVIKPVLGLIPRANLPGDQFGFTFNQPTAEDYGQARIDLTISDSDSMFGRYTDTEGRQVKTLSFPGFVTDRFSKNQYITVSESHVFSPTLLNTFRFSFSRTDVVLSSPTDVRSPEYIAGKGLGVFNLPIGEFGPRFSTPLLQNQRIFAFSDDLFYTRGAHSLKFGALINRYHRPAILGAASVGMAIFPTLSHFLSGTPVVTVARATGSILDNEWRLNSLGFYVQDDIRVRSNFTLNLGLRYEFITTPYEKNGNGGAVRDPLHDALPTCADPACLQADDPGKPFENPSLRNFSPRVGLAWDVRGDGRTALRAGAALLYDVATFGTAMFSLGWPYSSVARFPGGPLVLPLTFPPANSPAGKGGPGGPEFNLKQPYSIQYNFSVEQELPWNLGLTASYVGNRGIHLYHRYDANPAIPAGTPGVDAGGNRVCLDQGPVAYNPTGPKCWTGREPLSNRAWVDGSMLAAASNSWYNAFQFQVRKRMSRGLQFQNSYTFSKSIDEGQGFTDAENTTSHFFGADAFNRRYNKGVSQFDVRHNWAFNAIYRLPELYPSGGGAGALLNGWWFAGIVRASSGLPFTPSMGTNRSRSQVGGGEIGLERPDLPAGINPKDLTSGTSRGCDHIPAGTPVGTPDLWFDPCPFTLPPSGFLGTAGRNILRGDGLVNLDFTIAKDTALGFLGENGRLEFRAEFFNIFNHPTFRTPEIGLADTPREALIFGGAPAALGQPDTREPRLPSVGKLNGRTFESREIQLSLKVRF